MTNTPTPKHHYIKAYSVLSISWYEIELSSHVNVPTVLTAAKLLSGATSQELGVAAES